MTDFTSKQQSFVKNDIPTRLRHLASNLSEIKNFAASQSYQESMLNLTKESRYFIEWTVPDMIPVDVELAAELVDLGRVLTRWLFNWEKIWSDSEERNQVIQQASDWIKRVLEISHSSSGSMTA